MDEFTPKPSTRVHTLYSPPTLNNLMDNLLPAAESIEREVGRRRRAFMYGTFPSVIRETPSEHLRDLSDPEPDINKKRPLMTKRLTHTVPEHWVSVIDGLVNFTSGKKQAPCAPPMRFLSHLNRTAGKHLPPVRQFASHPVLRLDGTLLHGDIGYDPETCLYTSCEPVSITPMSPQDAEKTLRAWLAEFPFDDEHGDFWRAVLLAITLLRAPVSTGTSEGPPAWVFSAREAGTGKTMLAEVIYLAFTGQPLGVRAWPLKDVDEQRKTLMASSFEGHPAFLFDNVQRGGYIKGNDIELYVSGVVYTGRVLGVSENKHVFANSVPIFTGNDVECSDDMHSRSVPVRLVYRGSGAAYMRTYKTADLRAYTLAHREAILSALVSIANAATPESRQKAIERGRMPAWSEHCAAGVVAVAGADVLDMWLEDKVSSRAAGPELDALLKAMWQKREATVQQFGQPMDDDKIIRWTTPDIRKHCEHELHEFMTSQRSVMRHKGDDGEFDPAKVANKHVDRYLKMVNGEMTENGDLRFDRSKRSLGGRTHSKPAYVYGIEYLGAEPEMAM